MQVMKTKVEFQTQELIKEFQRISQYQIGRLREHMPLPNTLISGMTHFGLGRQAGHTEATANVVSNHAKDGENVLVISHNQNMNKIIQRLVLQQAPMPVDGEVYFETISNVSNHFRGLRVAFDHVLIDGPVSHMPAWRDTLGDTISLNPTPFSRVKSMVMVGS